MRRFALLCLLSLLAAIPALAQPAPGQILVTETASDDTPFVTDEDFPAVALEITPLDAAGLPIIGLAAEQFQLQEDNQPVPTFNLQAGTNLDKSISLLVLFDLSQPTRP
jgi:hypothetical protein